MQRAAILFLSLILTILFGWLLQFALGDIGDMEGPNRWDLREKMIPQELQDRQQAIREELRSTDLEITSQREDQALIRESLNNTQTTMQQLMALHRLSLEKGVSPTTKQTDALAESQSLFLENEARSEAVTRRVAELVKHKRDLSERAMTVEAELETAAEPADEKYAGLKRTHDLLLACLKLGLLVPLLVFVSRRAQRNRGKRFLAVWVAALVATFVHITLVMHEYFPSEVFKYIAITASILIILAFLISVLKRQVVRKPAEVNRRPIADSYSAGRCPHCAFPFQLRLREDARGRAVGRDVAVADREPYSCPNCGTGLFGACDACGTNRHTLLPYCVSCGAGSEEQAVPAT